MSAVAGAILYIVLFAIIAGYFVIKKIGDKNEGKNHLT
jgi:hypothetical protein